MEKKGIDRAFDIFEKANRYVGTAFSYLIIVMVVLTFAEVILRYVLHAPTKWTDLVVTLAFGSFFVMGGVLASLIRGHIRMDIFYNRIHSERAKGILDMVGALFFFLFAIPLLMQALPFTWTATLRHETIGEASFTVPVWPLYWVLIISLVMMAAQELVFLVRSAHRSLRNRSSK